MSDEKGPTQTTEDGQEAHHAEELIENLTPEEKKIWTEKFLKLEYYKAISQTIFQVVKDFSKWAAMLVSGVGALVGGWFSLQKMAKKNKAELTLMKEHQLGRARLDSGDRSVQAPVNTLGFSNKGTKDLADVVRKEQVNVENQTSSFLQSPLVLPDTTMLLTIISVIVFLMLTVKTLILDKRKKKGVS